MKKLIKRTLVGVGVFLTLLLFIYLSSLNEFIFDILLLVGLGVSLIEMLQLAEKSGIKVITAPLLMLLVALFPLIYFFSLKGVVIAAVCVLFLIFSFFIFTKEYTLTDFFYTVFVAFYPLIAFAFAFYIIHFEYKGAELGLIPFLLPLGGAFSGDMFAFYFGSMIKGCKPKFLEHVSPNKTYAGCIFEVPGGAVGGIIVYLLFEAWGFPLFAPFRFASFMEGVHPLVFYTSLGAFFAIIALFGDLFASRIKRAFGIKDFSNLLGPQGGITDRLDSAFFCIPVMALIIAIFAA
ncbi:MAG: phosphatidate cytidylyltransferase [Christensenellaceae bacterium]|jgi:phosphatidate cytidylyltransferase|nr:phosphatidate cytidylyltransferase [Christensenellaceae bacterium]